MLAIYLLTMLTYLCRFDPRSVLAFAGIVVAYVCLSIRPSMRQPWAGPRDNVWPIQARITKFEPEVQNTLVKIPIVLWVINLDPLIFKAKFNLTLKMPILSLSAP